MEKTGNAGSEKLGKLALQENCLKKLLIMAKNQGNKHRIRKYSSELKKTWVGIQRLQGGPR